MNASATTQRILIWMTLILIAIFSVGYACMMGFFPPPAPSMGASDVLALYTANNTEFRVGVVLCLLSGGFLLREQRLALCFCRQTRIDAGCGKLHGRRLTGRRCCFIGGQGWRRKNCTKRQGRNQPLSKLHKVNPQIITAICMTFCSRTR